MHTSPRPIDPGDRVEASAADTPSPTATALTWDWNALNHLADTVPQPAGIVGPSGLLEYVNPRGLKYLGVPLPALVGDSWTRILHPEALAQVAERWSFSLDGGDEEAMEIRVRHAEGTYRWNVVGTAPLRSPNGRLTRWLLTWVDIHDFKHATSDPPASEVRYRAIIESCLDAINLIAPDGTIQYSSPAGLDLLGYSPQELIGQNAFDFLHPEEEPTVRDQFRALLGSPGGSAISVHRCRHRDGSYRWLEARARNRLDDPAVRAIIVNFRDITAQRTSEERLRAIFQTSPECIKLLAPDGTLLKINAAGLDLLGAGSLAEVVGRPFVDRVAPEFRTAFLGLHQRVCAGESGRLDLDLVRPEGTRRRVEIHAAPIPGPEGQRLHLAMSRDMTERQQAEDALRREKALLDTALDSLPGVFYLFEESGRYLRWNHNLEQVSGYTADEIARMSPVDFVQPEERPLLAARIEECFRQGETSLEIGLRTKTGQSIPYYFTGRRVVLDGKPCLVGMGIDLSERQKLEEQFRQAQKLEAVGRLAGGVAHDFNNLLTVINGFSQLLLDGPNLDASARGLVAEIRRAGERATDLTRQLLTFSRRREITPTVLDINRALRDLQKMLVRLIGADVELVTDLAPDLPRVRMDPAQFEQIILNLAVNARDAMPQGGRLRIETRACDPPPDRPTPQRYVQLTVSDTGCGIAAEIQGQIFEPFFTTKGADQGTGLGLSTVYGIVAAYDGSIDFESAPNQGTTFRIRLPGLDRVREPVRASVEALPGAPRGTEVILLVEDEPSVRDLTTHVLQGQGYTVLGAADATEAIRICEEYPGAIDLMIIDVVVPGLSGRQLVDRLVTLRPQAAVLSVSGYTDDEVVRRGLSRAQVHYLQKPYPPLALARKVREVLDNRQGPQPPVSA